MKKIHFAIILFGLLFAGCQFNPFANPDLEAVKTAIIERENKGLPLFLQHHSDIHSITIDSLVLISNTKPYTGYLSTTWEYDRKVKLNISELSANNYSKLFRNDTVTKTILVEITDLTIKNSGTCNWISDWDQAYRDIFSENLENL